MEDFRIPYKRKQIRIWGVFSALQLIIWLVFYTYDSEAGSFFFGSGIFYLIAFIYQVFMPYIELKNACIKTYEIPFKTIPLNEVVEVKTFLDEVTFSSTKREIMISRNMMDEEGEQQLDELMAHLNEQLMTLCDSKKTLDPK